MDFNAIVQTLLCTLLLHTWALASTIWNLPLPLKSGVKDFCQSEYFNVSCGIGQVILMEHAFYGRMSGGRCITGTYGNTGCSQDVLPYMHSRCSAQRSCAVYIAEPTLHRMNPCPLDLASYLEADYSCIAVADQARDSDGYTNCRRGHRLELSVSSTAGYVSSESGSCLWTLQAEEGQTIQISLLSFGASSSANREEGCQKVGFIREELHSQVMQLCVPTRAQSTSHLASIVYQSSGSTVTLDMLAPHVLKKTTPFLIKYEAIGCPVPRAPQGGWIRLDKNMVEIRCNSSHDTWYLTCTGTEWAGEAGNCTNIENSRSQKGTNSDLKQEFPYKILIVVAIGVALGVFIGGLLLSLAAVYMKRKNRPRENPPEALGSMEVAYATQLRPSHMDYPMVFKDSHVVNDYPTFPQPSPNLSCPKHEIIYGRRCSQTPSFNSTSKSGRLYESPRHHAM